MRSRHLLASIAAIGTATAVLASCGPVSGGGWVTTQWGTKATFGVDLKCAVPPGGTSPILTGTFTYHDKDVASPVDPKDFPKGSLVVAGTLTAAMNFPCTIGPGGTSVGNYLPLIYVKTGKAGFGSFTVFDGFGKGQSKGDTLGVTLYDANKTNIYESGPGLAVHGNLTTTP